MTSIFVQSPTHGTWQNWQTHWWKSKIINKQIFKVFELRCLATWLQCKCHLVYNVSIVNWNNAATYKCETWTQWARRSEQKMTTLKEEKAWDRLLAPQGPLQCTKISPESVNSFCVHLRWSFNTLFYIKLLGIHIPVMLFLTINSRCGTATLKEILAS